MKSCLEVGSCPLLVLAGNILLDPRDGDGGPNTGPEEGNDPPDLSSVSTE